MYEPAGRTHGVYGDLRNCASLMVRRSRRWQRAARRQARVGWAVCERAGEAMRGGGPADLAVIGIAVGLAVDLGVRRRWPKRHGFDGG